MDKLTAFEDLALQCQELSFCEGIYLPPKLKSIEIHLQRTMPSVTERGLQSLTSLSSLTIGGKGDIVNRHLAKGAVAVHLSCVFHFLSSQ